VRAFCGSIIHKATGLEVGAWLQQQKEKRPH
jgi:hypothetical protein